MYTGSLGTITNAQTWERSIQVFDADTGAEIDLTGATISIAVRRKGSKTPEFTGDTSDGKVTIATSTFTWRFDVDEGISDLCDGLHEVGVTILYAGDTYQFVLADLTVKDSPNHG